MKRPAVTELARLGFPLAVAGGAWLVANRHLAPGVDVEAIKRGIAGPTTWPEVILYCVAACACAMFVRMLFGVIAGARAAEQPQAENDGYDETRLAAGIALLICYGYAISAIGFAWATLLFLLAWMVLGGVRRPVAIVLTSAIGTTALLYLFVKVSSMPLDRGKGVFEQATVALYRVLGIY
ncbi:MAG: tripartite tricarboxylate transporter TctB family protein [Betaproteobacteria bacterium]|nr:tripartite tricarboxylate transporter TctB family protein [Betaproteobacteria bacterium]